MDALERELAAVRAERDELLVDETRWQQLTEQSPLGIIAYRPDGTVKYANRALRVLFELTVEEHALLVAQYNIFEDPRLRESGRLEQIRKAFAGEVSVLPPSLYERPSPIEGRPVRRWLEGVMYPVMDREGAIREVVLIHTDITTRTRAETALRESEERFRELAESIREVFWLFDWKEERVVYVSPAFETVWGRSIESLYGDYGEWGRSVFPDDRAAAAASFQRIAESEGGEPRQYRIVRPDGEVRWISDRGFAVRDASGDVVRIAGIAEDVTERKREEEEHRRLELRVQQTQKLESLGTLAGGVAHDFNNLLMGVLANADVALVKLAAESPARAPLERIKAASQRAAELTKQMLAYSGRSSLRAESLDVNRVVEDMTHLLRAGISKKARLRFELAEVLPPVRADAAQVRQVVMSLITNAADSLGDDEGEILVATKVVEVDRPSLVQCDVGKLRAAGPYVSLEVTDTGRGMDEATQRRMFDPFFTTKLTGRGLGLAAVLGIVKSHEAALRVESAPGEGARFTLLFPSLEKLDELTRSEPASEPPSDGGETILLVDDEPTVREVTEILLQEAGYRVLLAADGHEAVEAVKEQGRGIDLVLLDMSMPGLSGEEALEAMRSMEPEVRVLLSSGYTEPDPGTLPPDNLAGFIQKPYGAEELRRKVATALAKPRKRPS